MSETPVSEKVKFSLIENMYFIQSSSRLSFEEKPFPFSRHYILTFRIMQIVAFSEIDNSHQIRNLAVNKNSDLV